MSEDEIIKIIKEYLSKIYIECTKVGAVGIPNEEWYAIKGLLDLYIKEKEKNKFINEVKAIGTDDVVNVVLTKSQYEYLLERATNGFNKEKEKNKELTDEYMIQKHLINSDFLKDYISKDKIREFKNKFIEDSKNEKVFMTQSSQINASLIQFCNELLEERN